MALNFHQSFQIEGDAQFPRIGIYEADDNLANVFANSQKAEQDFRDYPMVLRKAISLARRIQVSSK